MRCGPMMALLLLMSLWPLSAWSAVSLDTHAHAGGVDTTSISINSYTVTCAGGNAIVIGTAHIGLTPPSVTSMTYNSVPLTSYSTLTNGTSGRVEMWRLIAPTTGSAQTFAVTFSDMVIAEVGIASFCGVHQTTPLGTAVTQQGTLTSISDSITVPANGMAFEALHADGGAHTLTALSGATELWEAIPDYTSGAQTRSATGNIGWDWDTSPFLYATHIGAPINPAPAAAGAASVRRRFQ
jgi:hypothetical protein